MVGRVWRRGALLLLAAVAGAGVFWYLTRNTDAVAIRNLLGDLAAGASRTEGEKTSTGLWKIHTTGELFAPESELEFRNEMFSGKYGPEEIKSNLQRFRQLMKHSEVSYRDLELTVMPPDRAIAVFTGMLAGRTREGRRVEEVRNLVCDLRKIDGKWKIARISVRDILEK